jgi:hypothetical protein
MYSDYSPNDSAFRNPPETSQSSAEMNHYSNPRIVSKTTTSSCIKRENRGSRKYSPCPGQHYSRENSIHIEEEREKNPFEMAREQPQTEEKYEIHETYENYGNNEDCKNCDNYEDYEDCDDYGKCNRQRRRLYCNNYECEYCQNILRSLDCDKNCRKCDDDKKICTECFNNWKPFNGKCYNLLTSYYDCSIFNLDNCNKCSASGICELCSNDYELDINGKCKKQNKKLKKIIVPVIIIVILLILIIVICILKKRKNERINEIRINQRNMNNRFNANNNFNHPNLYRRNQNEQEILNSEKIMFEKDLTDEFNRQKINLEKNKLCQVCKNKNGKYISDCGCIVCQEHSNFKSIIKDGQNYKICFNCGKTIKDLTLMKTNCHICLQEVSSVCHFKCGCAIEVCESCYIKCKKISKKCPGCRGNI